MWASHLSQIQKASDQQQVGHQKALVAQNWEGIKELEFKW